jgi:hypothetical protein
MDEFYFDERGASLHLDLLDDWMFELSKENTARIHKTDANDHVCCLH